MFVTLSSALLPLSVVSRGRARTSALLFSSIAESSISKRAGRIPIFPNAPEAETSFPIKSQNPRTPRSFSPVLRVEPLWSPISKLRPRLSSTITHEMVTCMAGLSRFSRMAIASAISAGEPRSISAFCSFTSDTTSPEPGNSLESCGTRDSGVVAFSG